MGIKYRKSFKAGPFRVTASKSGISYSAGIKGARITKRADGRVQTTLSAPHTGLSYTSTSDPKRQPPSRQAPAQKKTAPAKKQAAPAKKQAAVKSARLSGQRSTVLPQPPPAGMRPLRFKGYLAAVTLYPDRIQIERTFMGRMSGSRSSGIQWQQQLVGVDFLEPTRLRNGHIHFATAVDPRGLTATGGGNRMAAVARNPHAIMFTWRQRAAYEQLRSLLMANAAVPPARMSPSTSTGDYTDSQRSVADELAKLHGLYQQGVLTPAEFEQAKTRLLGWDTAD
jgi:Protein of unknown function (DUF4236)/Short C-terminal domain